MLPLWPVLVTFRRRNARAAVTTLSTLALIVAAVVASPGPAAASVGTDQAQIARLQRQIAAQGARVKSLVGRYNDEQAHLATLDAQIADDQRLLAADQRAEDAAMLAVRRVAIRAYTVDTGIDSPTLALFSGTASITTTLAENQYLGAVNNSLTDALNALRVAKDRTEAARSSVRSEQARAKATLRRLAEARDAANSAIASDEATLAHVTGDLRTLLAVAAEQRQAAQRAAERALADAARQAAAAPPPPSQLPSPSTAPPPPSIPSPSPGGYANPLRAITALTPERIDQGVDYAGFGPIYAIGNGVVLNTVQSGWPGGTFIAYRLTDGPARGLVVYAAEDIEPGVQVGDTVTPNSVLGHVYAGPDGIETGWADAYALGNTMARSYGQFDGSNSTAFGVNFSRFLQTLGAPGGIQNGAPSGQLPAGWPRW